MRAIQTIVGCVVMVAGGLLMALGMWMAGRERAVVRLIDRSR